MRCSIEQIGDLGRKLEVIIAQKKISTAFDKRIRELSRSTKIQGFRPGRVPEKIVQNKFGAQVKQELIQKFVESSLKEAIQEHKLNPVASPKIEILDDSFANDLSFTATFEIYPEISLVPRDKLKIERFISQVTDEDVEKTVMHLRRQQAKLVEVDRGADWGDVLRIDFESQVEGEPYPKLESQDYQLELGGYEPISGIAEGLIGASAHAHVSLNLKFPDDYTDEKLRQKPLTIEVSIKSVNELVLPEIDDAFLLKFDLKDMNRESFYQHVRKNLEQELALVLRHSLKRSVFSALYIAHQPLKLPKLAIDSEIQRKKDILLERAEKQNLALDIDDEEIHEQVSRQFTTELIVTEIIRQHKLIPDPAKVRRLVEQQAMNYENPKQVVEWYYAHPEHLARIQLAVNEDQVVDWMIEEAEIKETQCSFDEIMNRKQLVE